MAERIDKTARHETPGAGLNKEVCSKNTINTFITAIKNAMSHFLQYNDRAWGLLRTTSKSEQYVLSYFTGYNIPCYLPHIRKVISKNKSVRRIMFPCYLFVAWGDQDFQIMKNCYHISHRIQSEVNADNDIIEQMEDIYRIEQLSRNRRFSVNENII